MLGFMTNYEENFMPKTEKNPMLVGAHTSAAGGAFHALLEGVEIGATTIQLFTANQRRWDSKAIDEKNIELWNETLEKTGLSHIMSHDSYLINLGAPDPECLKKSRNAFIEETKRCIQLGISYLNFHPGAALKDDRQQCMDRICESMALVEQLASGSQLRFLFEATAGQGSVIGFRFEELAYMIEKLRHRVRIGVCIDTCHIFVAGYDLRSEQACDETLREFDKVVGLEHLYAFHLNDSVKGLGSRVDRHAPLGKGQIGLECFKFLMTDPRTKNIPKYLETPDGPPLWREEIAMLKHFAQTK